MHDWGSFSLLWGYFALIMTFVLLAFPDVAGGAAFYLIARVLGSFQHKLATAPRRDWSEIGWFRRVGRLILIATVLGGLLGPVLWFVLR